MSYYRSVTNLFRAPWLTIGMTLCVTLLTMVTLVIGSLVTRISDIEWSFSEKLTVPVYLADEVTFGDEDIEHFIADLTSIVGDRGIIERTKEDALKQQLEKNKEGIDTLGASNPYPDSLLIIPTNDTLLSIRKTIKTFSYLTQEPEGVVGYEKLFQEIDEAYEAFDMIRFIGLVLLILFLAAIFSVMYLGSRAFVSHFWDELIIGKLIGAPHKRLVKPFFIQILIVTFVSWVVAYLLTGSLTSILTPVLSEFIWNDASFSLAPSWALSFLVFLGVVCIGGLSVTLVSSKSLYK